jgi:hypothetical protein
MSLLKGAFYTPGGEYLGDLVNPSGIRLTASSPGGWALCTWRSAVRFPYLGIADVLPNSRLELRDSEGLLARLRLEDPGPSLARTTSVLNFVTHGYAASLSDRFYETATTFAIGTMVETVVQTVRNDLCPDLSSSNRLIATTGRALSATTASWIDRTPADTLREITLLGTLLDEPLTWHVWEGLDRPGEKPELELITRPQAPDYFVTIGDGATVDLSMPYSEMVNRVVVVWGPTPTRTAVDDLDSQSLPPLGYGGIRAKRIDAPHITSEADARAIGRTALAQYSRVRARGRSITIPSTTPITNASGGQISPQRVRCGRMVEVSDLRAGALSTKQYQFLIAGTDYDDETEQLTITPELDPLVALLGRLTSTTR